LARDDSDKFLVRVDARAAALEDHRLRLRPLDDPNNRLCHIFHIGWLQSHQAAAEHRIDWEPAEKLEDGSEKRIVRSEHYGRSDDVCVGESSPDQEFTFAARSDVPWLGRGIGADSWNVNEPFDPGPVRFGGYPLRRLDVNGMKRLPPVLDVKADCVYNGVSAGKRIRDRPFVVNIGLDGSKLRIIAAKLTVPPIWMPWRDPDGKFAIAQMPDDEAAEKTGSAEHGDGATAA
jgi:hypothetical protein